MEGTAISVISTSQSRYVQSPYLAARPHPPIKLVLEKFSGSNAIMKNMSFAHEAVQTPHVRTAGQVHTSHSTGLSSTERP